MPPADDGSRAAAQVTRAAAVLTERTLEERVLRAWRSLRPGGAGHERLEVVRARADGSRAVFRLVDAAGAVIAKKCSADTGWIERAIYERVLPCLPVTAPRYHGFVEDGGGGWLFIEDVGRERFSPADAAHRVLAARWLAAMHRTAARVEAAAALPDRGPGHYVGLLRSARRALLDHAGVPGLDAAHAAVLRRVAGQCDALEAAWPRVADCCASAPATLVHGDFRRKNVYVRAEGTAGAGLYPIDWETAGWGVPAADLAPSRSVHAGRHIDLDTYGSLVREEWRALDPPALRRLARVGWLFRRLAGVHWTATNPGVEGEESIALLSADHAELAAILAVDPFVESAS